MTESIKYGLQLKQEGQLQKAEQVFRYLLQGHQNNHQARHHLGNTLVAANRLDEGITELKKAYAASPKDGLFAFNLGCALFQAQRFQEALAAFSRSVVLLPELVDARINRGNSYHALGRLEAALEEFDRALKLAPKEPDTHWNRALTLLTMGNYREGFKEYEWRWQRNLRTHTYPYQFRQKRWQGEPFPKQRLLIYSEQGLGDAIQFARFLPLAKDLGGKIIFEVRPELSQLLENTEGADEIGIFSPHKPRKNDFDLQIPLMSLPLALGIGINHLPRPTKIKPDPSKRTYWNAIIDREKINIGLAWAGCATHVNDLHRSIPFVEFNRLADLDNVQFYSLQTGIPGRQATNFTSPEKLSDYTSKLNDFTDTATLINKLDLVISVDTAVAHLAASLNRPTWILLSFVPDWRWQRTGSNSPWYPSATLFRQPRPGDWGSVMEEIRDLIKIKFKTSQTAI